MNNIFAALFVVAILAIIAFVAIGGSFDREFWRNFLPGFMQNLAALAVAVFIVERIIAKGRQDRLTQTNAAQSQFIFFLNNRMAFLLLKYLGLATSDEAHHDTEVNFEFAWDRLKSADVDLGTTFYEKLMATADAEKAAFIKGFVEILDKHQNSIVKALDKIYPRPDPNLKSMYVNSGMVAALKIVPESYEQANQQMRQEQKEELKPEHLELLIKVGYPPVQEQLQAIQEAIVELSEKAKDNKLFISLD